MNGCFCSGYAADNITHCVRPEDTRHRRAVIILRRFVTKPSNYRLIAHVITLNLKYVRIYI